MSLSNFVWAMDQKTPSPVAKLVLLYVTDGMGDDTRHAFQTLNIETFCCCDYDAVAAALAELDAAGLLHVWPSNEVFTDVALPWHRHEYREPSPVYRVNADRRRQLWDKQDGRCWYCGEGVSCDHLLEERPNGSREDPEGRVMPQIDHQHPRSRGGRSSADNLVLACVRCNQEKKAKTPDEYRLYLQARRGSAVIFFGEQS